MNSPKFSNCFSQGSTSLEEKESTMIKTNKRKNGSSINKQDILTRPCDQECQIPKFWATRILNEFHKLKPTLSIDELNERFLEFESCEGCNGDYNKCTLGLNCNDNLQFLNKIAIHYQHLRTVVRKFYHIRSILIAIFQCNEKISMENLLDIPDITYFNETNIYMKSM